MASLTVDGALQSVIRAFEGAKHRFQTAMQQRRGDQLAGKALAALKRHPGAPVYPIRWKSDKQRKAFFASDGFGGGIPHRRTYGIVEGFGAEFVATGDGGVLAITNPSDKAQFVHGPATQPFNLDTGWTQIADVEQDAYGEMADVATVVWLDSADPFQEIE